jgi:hypothetical protein
MPDASPTPPANDSQLWVEIATEPSNLNFSTTLSLNGSKWDVVFSSNKIKATSHKLYPVPGTGFDEKDRVIRSAMNQIVGHIRNLGYFSLGLDMKWGYEGGYTGTRIGDSMDIFPSIHQNGSVQFNQRYLERAQRILDDIGSSRKKNLKSLLNYWRRAKELDELGFDSEAYLNYFKVLECLAELNADDVTKRAIVDRFSPGGVPQKTLCKKYRAKTTAEQNNLRRQIIFAAKALSAANVSPKLSRGLFTKVLDIVFMRHGWNVAHKLLRSNPYDSYDAIGQHSDEFRLVMIENIYIRKITKLLILRYVKPGQYHFVKDGNMPMVMPVSGKGSKLDD